MSEFSSFYGGRAGASFCIKYLFDGVDIPQSEGNYTYREKVCAINIINNVKYFIWPLVEKDGNNYKNYTWDFWVLDGQVKNVIENGVIGTKTADRVLAEGMIQCFSKGGETTGLVNYGEYVIIDTIKNLQNVDSPDNGKVFRRGMEFDINKDPMAGAEYIGQIVGPKGDAIPVELGSLAEIVRDGGEAKDYTTMDGLVPGKDDQGNYHDNIRYVSFNYRNLEGELTSAAFGFEFPYMVQELNGIKRSPYYTVDDDIPAGSAVGDLLPADFNFVERIDDKSHPFFEEWQLNIPKGIKGDSLRDIEIYPTRPRKGSTLYLDNTLLNMYGTANGEEPINLEIYDSSSDAVPVIKDNITVYMDKKDGDRKQIRYKKYNYENKEAGDYEYEYTDSYKAFIEDFKVETRRDAGGAAEGSGSQKIQFRYNTGDDYYSIGEPINYIVDTYVVPKDSTEFNLRGHLLVYYSDPERRRVSPIANKFFRSERIGADVSGWTDMGNVKGEKGNINILDIYPTAQDIPNQSPEDIMGGDLNYAGYGALVGDESDPLATFRLYIYDYVDNEWHDIGVYLNDPGQFITIDSSGTSLADNGFIIYVDDKRGDQNVVTQIIHKNNGVFDPYPIGPDLKYVGGFKNSNIENLEEQIVLGTDFEKTVEKEYVTEESGLPLEKPYLKIVEETLYKVNASDHDYYKLVREIHKQPSKVYDKNTKHLILNLDPEIYSDTGILYYVTNEEVETARQVVDYVYDGGDATVTSVVTIPNE